MRRACLFVVLTLLAHPAFSQSWYTVEVLVFAHNNPETSEIWPEGSQPVYATNPVVIGAPEQHDGIDSSALSQGAWQPLPEDRTVLQFMMERMAQTGNYRELYHAAWRQPVGSKEDTLPVYIKGGNAITSEAGMIPELEGTLQFRKSRYLHVEPRLWFNTLREGKRIYVDITDDRRLSGHQAYYFDHAMFGMVVRVTR